MNYKAVFYSTVFLFFVTACKPDLKIPEPSSGDADFSEAIALGGNYMAGYTNGTLNKRGQEHDLANLIAKQLQLAGAGVFNQPLMPDDRGLGLNTRPWISEFVSNYRMAYEADCENVTALSPVKDIVQLASASSALNRVSSDIQNLSVAFATTQNMLDASFSDPYSPQHRNPYFNRFATNPGVVSMLDDAKKQNPTFSILWLGMEDIYEYARFGGFNISLATSIDFTARLDAILSALTVNQAKGVIANIPDYDNFPYYTYINPRSVELSKEMADSLNQATGGILNFTEGKNGFIIEYPFGSGYYRQMREDEHVLLSVPKDSLKCYKLGVFTDIPSRYCLDSAEIVKIKNAITDYNAVIKQKADQYNLAFVDMNAYFKKVKSGIKVNGVDYNMTFISGGFLSMDGFNPTEKGYALMANEFIKAINTKYNAAVPFVNCLDCEGVKFP